MLLIDLKKALNTSTSTGYDNLVTRPTGRAVRGEVERELGSISPDRLAVIDFGAVNILDYSCADEIVAKLLLDHGDARYFVLRGVSQAQMDAIEVVLERRGLATVAEDRSGQVNLLGPVTGLAKRAFVKVIEAGSAREDELVASLEGSPDSVRQALGELCDRRLIYFTSAEYLPLTAS